MSVLVADNMIIEEVLNGNKRAFEILIKKYQGTIYNYVFKRTLNKEDTEDITQEVFIKAYKNIYKLKDRNNFPNWLFKITINTMNSSFKRKKISIIPNEELILNLQCNINDLPEEVVGIKEKNMELLKKLEVLNEEEKNAIVLKYINCFSYREISEIMGIKEETAKMKVFRAKKKLYSYVRNNANERGGVYEM